MGLPSYKLKDIENVPRLPDVNWVNDPDLPAIFTVEEAPGVFFLNVHKWFDPVSGILTEEITPEEDGGIPSNPYNEGKEVTNIFVTKEGKLQIDYDDGT